MAETSEELAVGRARAEFPAKIQGHKPTAESREGGMETWQMEPGERVTEVELLVVETQAEPKKQ